MNNKIFRIILMFLAVCISSISTLFAVSFGLSNVTLDHDNRDLTQENEKLNDAVSDLQNTIKTWTLHRRLCLTKSAAKFGKLTLPKKATAFHCQPHPTLIRMFLKRPAD